MIEPLDATAASSPSCEQLQRELTQVRAELEEFTYSVSHDLRASLRHVTAYVQVIREDLGDQVDAEIGGYLNTVSQAARHMGHQIDALAELSRLGRVELHLAALDLGELVDQVLAELAPGLQGRALVWQVAPDVPALHGDAALIRQVLMHLLSNAAKFSQTRAPATITLSWAMQDNGQCVLTVSDNGVGFNPAYTAKLFHAFQRVHRQGEFVGLGMGLALTRKIVARHGGAVWAEGAPDAGCRISFSLPLAPP